jgi:hypothetical protein
MSARRHCRFHPVAQAFQLACACLRQAGQAGPDAFPGRTAIFIRARETLTPKGLSYSTIAAPTFDKFNATPIN